MTKNKEELELLEEYQNDVELRADTSGNPYTVSVWDENVMVLGPVAALQKEEVEWYAEGYSDGKNNHIGDGQ